LYCRTEQIIAVLYGFSRKNAEAAPRAVAAFISAYVFVWGGFSVIATALQWGLEESALLSTNMISANLIFGGAFQYLSVVRP
jgi:predicted metal-binding membrane protein